MATLQGLTRTVVLVESFAQHEKALVGLQADPNKRDLFLEPSEEDLHVSFLCRITLKPMDPILSGLKGFSRNYASVSQRGLLHLSFNAKPGELNPE